MQNKLSTSKNLRKFPVFDPIDSTPIEDENEQYRLKLCFCPLCQKGIEVLARERSRNVISWQYICRVIYYCLGILNKKQSYFSLKYDVHWFIVDHWYIFGELEQFRTNPTKWKKAILDAVIHCNAFESGKSAVHKAGVWRLKKFEAPWELDEEIPPVVPCPIIMNTNANTCTFINVTDLNTLSCLMNANLLNITPFGTMTKQMSTISSNDGLKMSNATLNCGGDMSNMLVSANIKVENKNSNEIVENKNSHEEENNYLLPNEEQVFASPQSQTSESNFNIEMNFSTTEWDFEDYDSGFLHQPMF